MKAQLQDIGEDVGEKLLEIGQGMKKQVKSDAQDMVKIGKAQIFGSSNDSSADNQQEQKPANPKKVQDDKKTPQMDPITGKPVASKRVLRELSQTLDQLEAAKLKKLREEFDKQKMKLTEEEEKEQGKQTEGTGPQVKKTEKKPDPGAVARTLAQGQSTGEIKGSVGG